MSFNDFKIPRKSGIVRRFLAENPIPVPTDEQVDKMCNMQYVEYLDLCHYCSEVPLGREEWLNQTIKITEE